MPDTDLPFARVLIEELEFIKVRREKIFKSSQSKPEERRGKLANEDPKDVVKEYWAKWEQDQSPKDGNQDELLAAARVKALSENLAGLAFSGGGIRSATFAIGVLQGLASLKLLRFFDVLSTVSGGGYAGGWLATWIRREGDPLNVERQLDFSRIRQGKAVRFSGNRIGIQVAGIVDEELRPLFDQLAHDFAGAAAPGRDLRESLRKIREGIGAEVLRLDGLTAPSHNHIIKLVHEQIDSAQKLISAQISERAAAVYGEKKGAIRARVEDLLARFLPPPEECGPALDPVTDVVDEEPEPIRHLRRYSSYLNPRAGILSADSWTLGAIYTRNVLINLLLLLPLAMTVVLFGRGVIYLYDEFARATDAKSLTWTNLEWPALPLFLVGAVFVISAVGLNAFVLWGIRSPERKWHAAGYHRARWLMILMLAGSVLVMMSYQPFLEWRRQRLISPSVDAPPPDLGYLGWINIWYHMKDIGGFALVMSLVISLLSFVLKPLKRLWKDLVTWLLPFVRERRWKDLVISLVTSLPLFDLKRRWKFPVSVKLELSKFPIAAVGSGVTTGVLIALVEELLRPMIRDEQPWLRAMTGPPLLLLAVVVGIAVQVALLGRVGSESEREWLGRLAAAMLLMALGWFVTLGVIVYGPAVLLGSHQLMAAALASGWVATTVAGVLAGKSGATTGAGGDRRLEWIARVAPPVFLIGLLAVVSTLAMYLLNDDVKAIGVQKTFDRALGVYLLTIKRTSWLRVVVWLAGSVIVATIASFLVNVNLFSLNALYANRLTRAFLGASRRTDEGRKRWDPADRDQRALAGAPTGVLGLTRDPNPVTDFDPHDDLELAQLRIGAGDGAARYWGPHVVINTALNLVGGGELAWRDRKAESFMLTPIHCGARSTGYAQTPEETGLWLSVGRAVSVSGAAVDPNMNFHQSAAVSMLLTIFNARLGVWIQNPNPDTWPKWWKGWPRQKKSAEWGAHKASYGGLLVKEILGETDEKANYVHISDGGHFDNLGVYELVKRRCRYIVAVDATENPLATSDNLGILVRLCRVDLGVRIEVNTAPLKVVGTDGISRAHVVIGRVRYDDVDHGQTPGMLIYIKSTMTGDEPPDVQQYANLHSEFPRQSTVDQSFDEDQFESYRALGDHVACVVFEEAAQSIFRDSDGDGEKWWEKKAEEELAKEELAKEEDDRAATIAFSQGHRKIFGALRNRWSEMPLLVDDRYLESTKAWRNLQRDLRSEPALARLAHDFYPELAILDDPGEGPTRRAELHKMEQVVQFMEDAWTGLGLKDHDEATIGRGWLNVFCRIAGSETFRLFWPLLRAECGPEFTRFCERRLRANRTKPWLREIGWSDPAVETLGAEFAREWPGALGRHHSSKENEIDPRDVETLAEAGRRYLTSGTGSTSRSCPRGTACRRCGRPG